jgi:hypothetical protein
MRAQPRVRCDRGGVTADRALVRARGFGPDAGPHVCAAFVRSAVLRRAARAHRPRLAVEITREARLGEVTQAASVVGPRVALRARDVDLVTRAVPMVLAEGAGAARVRSQGEGRADARLRRHSRIDRYVRDGPHDCIERGAGRCVVVARSDGAVAVNAKSGEEQKAKRGSQARAVHGVA